MHLPSLHQPLDALLPPDRQLRALTLTSSCVLRHATADCPALEDLRELSLENVECDWGVMDVLMDILEQTPALARLRLYTTASASRYNDRWAGQVAALQHVGWHACAGQSKPSHTSIVLQRVCLAFVYSQPQAPHQRAAAACGVFGRTHRPVHQRPPSHRLQPGSLPDRCSAWGWPGDRVPGLGCWLHGDTSDRNHFP